MVLLSEKGSFHRRREWGRLSSATSLGGDRVGEREEVLIADTGRIQSASNTRLEKD